MQQIENDVPAETVRLVDAAQEAMAELRRARSRGIGVGVALERARMAVEAVQAALDGDVRRIALFGRSDEIMRVVR